MKIKTRYWALAVALIVLALVMVNLAIVFSSQPNDTNQGWAIFFGFNAAWIAVLGCAAACYAESTDVRLRQLDYDRAQEVEVT